MKTNRTARLMEKFVLPADAGSPVASAFLQCVFRRERQLGRGRSRGFGLRGRFVCTFLLSCIFALPGCGDTGSRGSVILDDSRTDRASLVDSEAMPSVVAEGPSLSVPSPPAFLDGESSRLSWLCEHYWDNLDWDDVRWIADTAALEGAFTPWAQILSRLPQEQTVPLVRNLISQGNDHPRMQLCLLNVAEYFWHHPNSPFRSEELFIPVLETVVDAPGIDSLYKIRPRSQLSSARKNRPGSRAADFTYETGGGGRGTLYGFRSEYTLLMFYNPGCPECARIESYIPCSEVFGPLLSSGRLKVLAVYPDEDVEAWRKHLPQMPRGWTVVHAPMGKGGRGAYDLPGIPALYLLGRDKTVLVKDGPVESLESWFSQQASFGEDDR